MSQIKCLRHLYYTLKRLVKLQLRLIVIAYIAQIDIVIE